MDWFAGKDQVWESAIASDSAQAVDAAIRDGADVNATGVRGVTPLMYAVGHSKKNAYAALLAKGAHLDTRDEEGDNAVTLAVSAYAKDPSYLTLALDAGSDPNTLRSDDDPVLVRFVNDRNLDAIRMMHRFKADINARTRTGEALIIHAGLLEYWDVVECLLQLGARFDYSGEPFTVQDIFSDARVTPPDSPLFPHKVRVAKFLRERGVVIAPFEKQ